MEDKNADSWAGCILNIFKNKKLFNDIRINASETIKENYTWDSITDVFINMYKIKKEKN